MPTKDSPKSRGVIGGCRGGAKKLAPEKSASLHGRLPSENRAIRRTKTQPDVLEERRVSGAGTPPWEAVPAVAPAQRVPTKILVNVTVQRSLGAVKVVASTDWTVGHLVAAVLQQYTKEERRPLLPSEQPSAFGLHYSQFSFEGLDPAERLIGLGSRNFFLCPKPAVQGGSSPRVWGTGSSSCAPEKTCSKEAAAAAAKSSQAVPSLPWLGFMDLLL